MARLIIRPLLVLLLLAVLLTVADRGAAVLVTQAVAQELQQSQRLSTSPAVTVRGVPFLTQAFTGRYDVVDIALRDVPIAGGVAVDRLDATLYGVHAPWRQALAGGLSSLPVDRAEASGHVTFAALQVAANAMLADRGVQVALGRAGADRVAVTAQVGTLIGQFSVRGEARVSVSKGRIMVSLVPQSLSGVPGTVRDAVLRQLDLSVLAPALPFGLSIRSVAVDGSGLQLEATGSNLLIA